MRDLRLCSEWPTKKLAVFRMQTVTFLKKRWLKEVPKFLSFRCGGETSCLFKYPLISDYLP